MRTHGGRTRRGEETFGALLRPADPQGWVMQTHARGPPPEMGEGAGGGTQMRWDGSLGILVVWTDSRWGGKQRKVQILSP